MNFGWVSGSTRRGVLAALAVVGMIAMTTAGPSLAGKAATGSCVVCHRHATGIAYVEHNYADWTGSVHAAAGVGCDGCHGGDPAAKEKAAAHAGVLLSSVPSSPVYYTRLPETCGRCHEDILKAFRRSRHYEELNRSGRGPNCATCHGAMASHVLEPRMIQMTCTLCHRAPSGAQAALTALNNAGAQLARLKRALAGAKADGLEAGPQRASYEQAQARYRDTRIAWHAFDVAVVLNASQEISQRAATTLNELALKRQQR